MIPSIIAVVVAFDMIGGLDTVIFVVVVTAGFSVVVVVVLGIAVVVALVVVIALAVGRSVCVVYAVVVVALTGSCSADTGSVVVARVVVRLMVSVADTAVVVVVTGAVVVVVRDMVVVAAVGSFTLGVVLTAWLGALLVTDEVVSLSVITAEVEVFGVVSAVGSVIGSAVCAQPDSRAARMSIAIAFFILVTSLSTNNTTPAKE